MKKTLLLLFLLPLLALAQTYPDRPLNYVTDDAHVLSPEEEKAIDHKLHLFQDSTSNQIFIYVASNLNGADLETISQDIFVKWDIGQKGKNNGILIAIFVNDHKFRIHTGYGLEGALPDLLTKKIQDEEMRPSFKQNNYYAGIDKGIDKLIYFSKNEYKPESTDVKVNDKDVVVGMILMYIFAAVLYCLYFLLIRYVFKENKTAKIVFYCIGGVFFLIPFFGLFALGFSLIILSIIAVVKVASKVSGRSGSYTSAGYTDYPRDNSWYSSSSNDSSWSSSSSSDSDSSFSGGGGGDSGGGGSSSDW